jgi:hypothetical protein
MLPPGERGRTVGRMRFVAALLVVAGAGTAHADVIAQGSAGLGAGAVGDEVLSAAEVRGDLAWTSGAAGLAARVEMIGDEVDRTDWDEVADWIAIVRYVVMRNEAAREESRLVAPDHRWRAEAAAGTLAPLHVGSGTVVDGFVSNVIADRRATSFAGRLARGETQVELIAGDVARGEVLAGAARAPVGPVEIGGGVAIDPRAPTIMLQTSTFIALDLSVGIGGLLEETEDRDPARGRVALDGGFQPGLGGGVALVADGEMRVGEQTFLRARGELGVGTTGYVAAPFGPLYLRLRENAGEMTTLFERARTNDLGGVGGALSLGADRDDLGSVTASFRHRPGLGDEWTARLAAPARSRVQAAALVAWMPQLDAFLLGGEARGELGYDLWSALDPSRRARSPAPSPEHPDTCYASVPTGDARRSRAAAATTT